MIKINGTNRKNVASENTPFADWYKEYKKSSSTTEKTTQETSDTEESSENTPYAEWYQRYKIKEARGITEQSKGYNDWLTRVNELSEGLFSDYTARDGKYQSAEDFGKYYSDVSAQIQGLLDEGQSYYDYFSQYGDVYDEYYEGGFKDNFLTNYESLTKYLTNANDNLASENEMWAQFANEKEYNDAIAAQELQTELASMDIDAAKVELEEKKVTYQKYYTEVSRCYNVITQSEIRLGEVNRQLNSLSGLTSKERYALEQEAKQLQATIASAKDYISKIDLSTPKNTIDELEHKITLAERLQAIGEFEMIPTVSDPNSEHYDPESENYDPDFYAYVQSGLRRDEAGENLNLGDGAVADTLENALSKYTVAYLRNNPLPDAIKFILDNVKYANPQVDELLLRYKAAQYMKEEEFNAYCYYRGKDEENGTNTADEYLWLIRERLYEREGNKIAEGLEDKPTFVKQLYSVVAGADQFSSGMKGLSADGYTPTSSIQYASSAIRKDLADEGIFRWYNFKTKKWEDKFFGSSSAQAIYDIGSTTANMLPSILVSVAVEAALPTIGEGLGVGIALNSASKIGAAAGASVLGLSAAGNAKVEMLNLGYSKEQANAYAVLIGASEAGLSYLMSGIPGLRGGDGVVSGLATKVLSKVDNALAKVAIAFGGVIDEGVEEGLQTILETWFKEVVTGADFEDPTVDEVLYSSLLGMLSAAGFSVGNVGVNHVSKQISINAETERYGQSIIDQGMVAELQASSAKLSDNKAVARLSGKVAKKATAKNVGKLALSLSHSQMSSAIQSRLGEDSRAVADTITDAIMGRDVSNRALRAVMKNDGAIALVNETLGTNFTKDSSISDIRKAFEGNTGTKASRGKQQGSEAKISDQSPARFSVAESESGGFDVITEGNGESVVIMHYDTQRQAQAAAYAQTLKMGGEGLKGLVSLAEGLSEGVDLGDAALAFNALYNQGKKGVAMIAAENASLLSPYQREMAYQAGVVDGILERSREKSSSEVLQNDAVDGKIDTTQLRRENSDGKERKVDNGGDGRRGSSKHAQEQVGEGSRGVQMADRNSSQSRVDTRAGGERVLGTDSEGIRVQVEILNRIADTAIVDEQGHPIAVYHATDANFDVFNKGDIGFHFGNTEQAAKRANDKKIDSPKYIRAYLNIKNPIVSTRDTMSWNTRATTLNLWSMGILTDSERAIIEKLDSNKADEYNSPAAIKLREILESKGYDGISYPNGFEGEGTSYIAFHDEQIVRVNDTFEAQSAKENAIGPERVVYSSGGALMGAGFGGFGSAVSYKNNKTIGAKYASDPSILIESALELDKNNKRALELKAKLDANQTISNAELGALKLEVNELRSRANSDMNDQKRAALRERIEKRLGARISDKTERAALAEDLTDIIRGNSVSDRALRGIVKNQAALNILNDALGTRFKASDKLTVGGVRNDIKRAFSGMQSAQQDAISILKLNESERTVLSEVMPSGLDDAQQLDFTAAFSVVYRAAMSGKDIGSINSSIVTEAGLTQNQIQEIYYRGRIDYLQNLSKNNSTKADPEFLDEDKVEESQKKIDAAKRSDGKKKKGAVIYDGDRSKLSDMQKKSLEVLDKISEALGITFHIYESRMINGKYVYEKPNGVKMSANGWYDTKTGEIWLDINAGNNGEGVMIFTAAHELTHFIKQWSPAKFKIFADFLIEQYQDHNISVDELVRRQIDKAKKNGRTLTSDQAYEEVIADSCESFLRDSDAVEKIVELNQKDAGLAAKIKQFIGNMLKRLRELMKGINPQSREGQIVVDMTSALEQLHKLWTDALADAGEAYSVIGAKDSDVDSGYRFAERDYPIDHDVEKVVNQALTNSNSSMHNLSPITSKQIKRIHRLGTPKNDIAYRGKFEGGNHLFSDIAIRHIISEHGDFLREALRAQLPMTPKDIARHLSAIKSDKEPSNIIPTRTGRGQASILTSYEVNGYTLFAEEITKKPGKNLPSDLIGHTMYKAPTLATAHFYATSAQTQPKRQSTVLCNYYTPNSKNLSIGNFVQNSEGKPAQLNYLSVNGTIKQDPKTSGLIALSSDASNFTDKSGKVEQGYVRCQKPFYITANNRVFSNSKTNASEKIEDLKKQGYDCFIFEKTPGDNYMVAVVNKAQIIKDVPTVADGSEMHSDRDSNHSEAALEEFGVTGDFDMTGFVLEDGQMLKLSPYGLKGVNHSLIAKVYDGIKGSAAVNRFIQEGNVRIKASSPGIEISSEKDLTVSQYNIVSRFISRALRNRGVFYVDITDVNGNEVASITYDEDASAEEIKYDIKNYYKSGRIPKRSDFFFSERDPDAPTNRELLVNALETDNMSPSEKGFLTKYKNKIAQIEANEAEISNMKAELKELQKNGKGKTAKAISLEGKISTLEKQNGVSERLILNLEATKPIRELLRRERDAVYKKAVAEGREKLAEYKDKVKKREKEIRQGYRDSRKKAVEGRSKTAVRHKIANVVAELDKLLRHGNKKSNVKIGLQSAVASALEVFDHNSDKVKRYQKSIADLDARIAAATDPVEIEALTVLRDKKKRNSERLSDKLQVMKKAYEDIHNGRDGENYPSYYKAEAEAIENRIAEVMEKVGDTSISDMSLDQLEAVYEMYRMVLTTVRNANKVFRDGKLADLTEDATEMENELQRIKKLPEERLKAGDSIRSFVWNELTPYYAFNRIGSKVLMGYYDELVRGQDVYARDITEAKEFAEETRAKHGYGKWKLDKVHHFKDKDGRNFDLTLKHMMSIYAYSKREQALDHMERGGFFFNNKETFRKKGGVLEFIASNESGYKVDAQVFAMIKGALTKEQVAYVDEMQEYLTLMGEKGNEVTRVMWGIDIFKEKVYFPLKSKEDFIYQANTPAETSSLKNDGMTKETKPHASNPIVLEAFDDVWANHVNKMSTYHGFVVPIDNLNKLVNYGTWIEGDSQSISTMLEARYGSGANEYLTTFIKDLNGAKAQSGGFIGGISNLFTKFKKTAVAASLSVVVQQPTAIIRALSEIDIKHFAHLPKLESLNKRWELIQKYAPIAIIKDIGGFDTGSGRTTVEWLNSDTKRGVDKAMNRIDDLTMYGAALGDRIGWSSIWVAVEREVQAKQGLEYGTDEFLEACGKRFTEVIVKTQVYDSTLSRSGFMRGKDGLMKMATAFMGEPTLSVNMMIDAVLQAKRGRIKARKAARTIASVYTATLAASIVKSFIYALRDDDEDESYMEKYLQAIGGNFWTDIFPITMILNMLPVLRDVMSIFDGWDVERTDMALVADLKNATDELNSDSKGTWRKIEDFAGAIAAFAGVPLKNVMRTAREMYNLVENIFDGINGGNLGGAFVEGVTGKESSKSASLYDALIGGDTERIEIYKKTYKSEEAYQSAVRRALREHDRRVQRAVEGVLSGKPGIYNDLKNDVRAEKHFDVKTVNEAFADEREYVLGKLNDARKARREGDTAEYNKIVEQLIKRGYSEEFVKRKLK